MEWTTDQPTEPGLYWFFRDGDPRPVAVEVYGTTRALCLHDPFAHTLRQMPDRVADAHGLWAPCEPPPLPDTAAAFDLGEPVG